ncbi:MAG: hypothetical protein FJZ62_00815 [Chlamydiae bacterium]|nr:hypothetical protein [Chlamydiota bacterium]
MARAVTFVEPKQISAGTKASFRFLFVTDIALPQKSLIRFDLGINDPNKDFEIPTTNLKEQQNCIWLTLSDSKVIEGKQKKDLEGRPVFDFVLPKPLEVGEKLMIVLGSQIAEKAKEFGTRAPLKAQRKRPIHLYIDPKGKGDFSEPYTFNLDIKGAELKNIRILAPSLVSRNQRFDVVIRFEDQYSNLTSNAPKDTLIEFSHDRLRDNLKMRLFVSESGVTCLPNLYFNEPGVYRLSFKNTLTSEITLSHPIFCQAEEGDQAFYGSFQGMRPIESLDQVEVLLREARDTEHLQFFSLSPQDSETDTSNELWKEIQTYTAEFNEEDRFVTFLGFTYNTQEPQEGNKIILFSKDQKPIYRRKETKTSSLSKILKAHIPKDLFIVSLDPSQKLVEEFEKGVVYRPQKHKEIFKLYDEGKRFALIGEDLTCILANQLNRDTLIAAIENRKTFASINGRMLAQFSIATQPIGSVLTTKSRPGLMYVRHLKGFIAGNKPFKELTIYRNDQPVITLKNLDSFVEFEEYDESKLDQALIHEAHGVRFCYYYLKAIQEDGAYLITSPIFIEDNEHQDHDEQSAKKKVVSKK